MLGTLFTTVLSLTPSPPLQEAPPGLIRVEGERTKVGSDPEDIEHLILQNEEIAGVFAGETPEMTVEVEDFFLGVTEVTNEQYAEFVRATGAKPPYQWGQAALEKGRLAFLEEQARKRKEAIDQGERPPDRKTFDAERWWEENWEGSEWEVPTDRLSLPVTYITYQDAQGYASWAGLRLMTEFEYMCAARGASDRLYPWGDEWKSQGMCQSREAGRDDATAVGSFPDGAVNGVYDLVGNVWEWTASPYTAFKKYKPVKVKARDSRKTITAAAGFDPNYRVVVSGSFKQGQDGLRVTTRQGAMRSQATEALGFRVAGSTAPGLDVAAHLIDEVLDFRALPQGIEFTPRATLVRQRWTSREGAAKVPGYAVITGHERFLFTPVAELDFTGDLAKETRDGPMMIGFLTTSHPMAAPELDAGTFYIGWRGAGKVDKEILEGESDDLFPFHKVHGFQAEQNCFFLYTTDGTPQVAFPASDATYERLKPGSVAFESYVPPTEKELEKLQKEGKPIPPAVDTLRFGFTVPSKSKSRGFTFSLPVKLGQGVVDASWQ